MSVEVWSDLTDKLALGRTLVRVDENTPGDSSYAKGQASAAESDKM